MLQILVFPAGARAAPVAFHLENRCAHRALVLVKIDNGKWLL